MQIARRILLTVFLVIASCFTSLAPSWATVDGSLSAPSVSVKWYTSYPSYVMTDLSVSVATGPTFGVSGTTGQTFTGTVSGGTTAPNNFTVYALCKTPAGAWSTMLGSGQVFNDVSSTTPRTASVTFGTCSNSGSGGVFDRLWIGTSGGPVMPAADGSGSAVQDVAGPGNGKYGVWWFPIGHSFYEPPPPPVIDAGNCRMTDSQIVQVARAGGFLETNLRVALAIAMAESALKVNALNENGNGSFDIGLWQINDMAHPEYDRQQLGINPTYNATTAFDIFTDSGNFSPWVTYDTGAYLAFMDRAYTAIQNAPAGALTLTDCSGGTNGPVDPDDIDPATDDGSEQCSGWNPLTYFKCALRWAFVPPAGTMDGWQVSIGEISDGPPISWIVGGFAFCNAFLDGITGNQGAAIDDSLTSMSTPDGQSINFLAGARSATQESSAYSIFFAAQVIAIWGGAGWLMLNMVNRRFGGKE